MIDRPSKGADRRGALLAWGAALVTVVLWASAFVGIRAAGEDLSPGALSLARLLVGSAALGALVLIRRERLPARRDLPAIALCGVLWFGLYNVALNAAERLVDAGTAAMLVGIGPVLVAVFAGVLLGEGFPRSLFAGCAVAFAGVVVIGLVTSGRGLDGSLGAVLCLVAALAYAGGVAAQKPVLARVSALQVTWLACGVGAIACLPFAPTLLRELGEADAPAIGWAVYLGAFPRRPWPSRRGRTPSLGRPRAGWRRPPTSCRRSRYSWGGRSSGKCPRSSPCSAAPCAWRAWPSLDAEVAFLRYCRACDGYV